MSSWATCSASHGIRLGVGLSTDARLRQGRAFQFIQGVDAFLMLFKSIDSANVGVALDLWHWHLGGGTLDQIRSLGDKIVTVSLADADPGMTASNADENTRRLPGETGVIDSVAVLSALSEAALRRTRDRDAVEGGICRTGPREDRQANRRRAGHCLESRRLGRAARRREPAD